MYGMVRNPRNKNSGAFLSLADFLTFARDKPLSGVLISIEASTEKSQIRSRKLFFFLISECMTQSYRFRTSIFNPSHVDYPQYQFGNEFAFYDPSIN